MQHPAHQSEEKIKKVIVLVDNRASFYPVDKTQKPINYDYRNSAFKETQIDPSQSRYDFSNSQEFIIQELHKRLFQLENRIQKLESFNESLINEEFKVHLKKKMRRKASEISRRHVCPFQECQRIYGSQTSLRNHLRLKHDSNKPVLTQNA